MSPRALARLVLGCLVAAAAFTLALVLGSGTAARDDVPAARGAVGTGVAAQVAPSTQSAQSVLAAQVLSPSGTTDRAGRQQRPTHVHEDGHPHRHPGPAPAPVDTDEAAGLLPGHQHLGPMHDDPLPAGVSLEDPVDTASLYARAGLARSAAPSTARSSVASTAAGDIPPGAPSMEGLREHVASSCTGTGTDGHRVQALYVRERSTSSRYSAVLPLLRNEIANVDDVFALSARKTGGERRVRWVHDDCVPVVAEVVLPDGSLTDDVWDMVEALRARGYTDPARKYLAFAEAADLCGVGTVYDDASRSGNRNDGYAASYARVDAPCWSTRGSSIPAHELTHNLGGVLSNAPHATRYGHCFDESDVMCYDDGSGVPMSRVCAPDQEQLLDCRDDDYFNTAPEPGSFLAANWNTADSSFLDDLAAPTDPAEPPAPAEPPTPTEPTAPEVTVQPSTTVAETGDRVVVTAVSTTATAYHWTASAACTLTGAATARLTVLCPASVTGPVRLSVAASDAEGRSVTASATLQVSRAPAPTAAVEAPSQVSGAVPVTARAVGKAPFGYRWTTTGPCSLSSATAADPTLSCPADAAGPDGTVGLQVTVTQADGQQVTSDPVAVAVTTGDGADQVGAAGWTPLRVTGVRRAVLRAELRDASGAAVAGQVALLETRRHRRDAWRPATRHREPVTLATGAAGQARVRVGRAHAAWYRLRAPADAATGRPEAVSDEVRVRPLARARIVRHGARRWVLGRLTDAAGSPVADARLVLQRRYGVRSPWVRVGARVTGTDGKVRVRQRHGRRTTYFRWVFTGGGERPATRTVVLRRR